MTLSETQKKVLRILANGPSYGLQLAGYGTAPLLSGARALVRRGLAGNAEKTGHYFITDAGREIVNAGGAVKSGGSHV